jgi:hypothetical protein
MPSKVRVVLSVLSLAGLGGLAAWFPHDRKADLPGLQVFESGKGIDGRMVSFRVIVPESQRQRSWVISKPELVDSAGNVWRVGFVRYGRNPGEPTTGFVVGGEPVGDYHFRLRVAREQTGVHGLLHRIVTCWERKRLSSLRETPYGEDLLLSSQWVTIDP